MKTPRLIALGFCMIAPIVALAGVSAEFKVQSIRMDGVIEMGDGYRIKANAALDDSGAARISTFEVTVNDKLLEVPLVELQELDDPDLQVTYFHISKPGVIPIMLGPELGGDPRDRLEIYVSYGPSATCLRPAMDSDLVQRSSAILRYSLEGEYWGMETFTGCENCLSEGFECENDETSDVSE